MLMTNHSGMTIEAALRDALHARLPGRLVAIAALGRAPSERRTEAAAVLRQALPDRDARIRQASAMALGELRDVAVLDELVAQCERDPDPLARQGAVIALGRIGLARASAALRRALSDASADVRFHAVAALVEAAPQEAAEALPPLLDDGDAEVRGSVAAALGDLGDTRSIEALARLLDDGERSTRVEAAVALSRLGDRRSTIVLLAHLSDDDLGPLVAERLFAAPDPSAREALRARAGRRFGSPVARVWVAGALARLGAPEGQQRLLQALASRRTPVRGLAIEVLGRLGEPWARAALQQLSQSRAGRDWYDEIAAALATNVDALRSSAVLGDGSNL